VALTTIVTGLLLIAVGIAGYTQGTRDAQGKVSPTALIPAGLGAVFVLLGLLALKENARKHAMHLAATLGLIGFFAALWRPVLAAVRGTLEASLPVFCQLLMAAICAAFVGLCVRSFIAARRRRAAGIPSNSATSQ
jgi:hypothetical protein